MKVNVILIAVILANFIVLNGALFLKAPHVSNAAVEKAVHQVILNKINFLFKKIGKQSRSLKIFNYST